MTLALALALSSSALADVELYLSEDSTISVEEAAAGGGTIGLGGLGFRGIEPDEIDFTAAALPSVHLGPITLHGIEPDEIDNALTEQGSLEILFLDDRDPAPATREHVLLARQVEVPLTEQLVVGWQRDRTGAWQSVTTTGSLVLVPTAGVVREQTDRTGAVHRSLELSFAIEGVDADPAIEVEAVLLQDEGALDGTIEVVHQAPRRVR